MQKVYITNNNILIAKHMVLELIQYLILKLLADLPETQCAAVTTQLGDTKDPPHIVLPLKSISICHGQAPCLAFSPAITLPC